MYGYFINTCLALYKKTKSVKENIRGVFLSTRIAAEECYPDEDSKDIPENNNLSLALEEDCTSSFEPIVRGGAHELNHDIKEFSEPEGLALELEEYYSDDGSENISENSDSLKKDVTTSLEPILQEDTMNYDGWACHEPEDSPPIIVGVGSSWFRQFEEGENKIAPANRHFAPFLGFDKVGIEALGGVYSIDETSDYG